MYYLAVFQILHSDISGEITSSLFFNLANKTLKKFCTQNRTVFLIELNSWGYHMNNDMKHTINEYYAVVFQSLIHLLNHSFIQKFPSLFRL